jgi:hypothetical protein
MKYRRAAVSLSLRASCMRQLLRASALILAMSAATALTSTTAVAFGDTCYRDVKARGSVQRSMSSARGAAIAAWQQAVAKRYGSRFANWYYSADRTFECSWDASGRNIRCIAIAGPCARKR